MNKSWKSNFAFCTLCRQLTFLTLRATFIYKRRTQRIAGGRTHGMVGPTGNPQRNTYVFTLFIWLVRDISLLLPAPEPGRKQCHECRAGLGAAAVLLIFFLAGAHRGDCSHSPHTTHSVLSLQKKKEHELLSFSRCYCRQRLAGRLLWRQLHWWFGMESHPVSRLNLLQMLSSRRHAGSKFQTCNSAHILSATLIKHPRSQLHSAPSLWFYSTPKFAACPRLQRGEHSSASDARRVSTTALQNTWCQAAISCQNKAQTVIVVKETQTNSTQKVVLVMGILFQQ